MYKILQFISVALSKNKAISFSNRKKLCLNRNKGEVKIF